MEQWLYGFSSAISCIFTKSSTLFLPLLGDYRICHPNWGWNAQTPGLSWAAPGKTWRCGRTP